MYHKYCLSEYDKEKTVPRGQITASIPQALLETLVQNRKASLRPNQDPDDWMNLAFDRSQLNLNSAKRAYKDKFNGLIAEMKGQLTLLETKSGHLLQRLNRAGNERD